MAKRYDGASELRRASKRRQEDAYALHTAGRHRGAMYVAGYAVECLLKAKLMQMFNCRTLEGLDDRLRQMGRLGTDTSLYTHQLVLLLRLTGRLDALQHNVPTWRQFLLVNLWLPAWRYEPTNGNATEADRFLEATDAIIGWVENNV
jgi:HEPN domain-containing protein